MATLACATGGPSRADKHAGAFVLEINFHLQRPPFAQAESRLAAAWCAHFRLSGAPVLVANLAGYPKSGPLIQSGRPGGLIEPFREHHF